MIFKHNIIELPKLERIDSNIGPRLYLTPDGKKYPSVTSILGSTSDKSGLHAWRKRIGAEEADKITRRAANRGTKIHTLCEDLISNKDIDTSKLMPVQNKLFKQIKPVILERVNNIVCMESKLFSHKLKAAGSVDLIANFDNILSVIDYKTSLKPKKKEWIQDYFLQTTMYSYMFYEMTGIMCKRIVVLIVNEEGLDPQIFIENPANYIREASLRCKTFHEKFTS